MPKLRYRLGRSGIRSALAGATCTYPLTARRSRQVHDPAAAFAVLDRSLHRGSVKGQVRTIFSTVLCRICVCHPAVYRSLQVSARELKKIMIKWGSQNERNELTGEEVEDMVDRADLSMAVA
jgi:hypothetical protein